MQIKKTDFEINETFSVVINKKFNYAYNLNNHNKVLIFLKYLNYKTFKLNGLYLSLLPIKIQNLKQIKNHYLKLLYYYKNSNESIKKDDYFKLYELMQNKAIAKEINDLINQGYIKPFESQQINNIKNVYEKENFILSIKFLIKFIDKRIKVYQNHLKHKKSLFQYKINQYDLNSFQNGIITNNIKTAIYFYLNKLKKTKIKQTSLNYLNNDLIKDLINKYSEKDILKDFDLMIQNDLINFENHFLNKTI